MNKIKLLARQLDGETFVEQGPDFRLVDGWSQADLPTPAGILPADLWGRVPGGDPYLLHVNVLSTVPLGGGDIFELQSGPPMQPRARYCPLPSNHHLVLVRPTDRLRLLVAQQHVRIELLVESVGGVNELGSRLFDWAQAARSGGGPVISLVTGRSLGTTLPVGATLGAVSMLLWLIGATLTAWGEGITAPLRWWRARRGLRRIDPLWAALRAALPQIALETGRGASLRGPEFALYRRVIEIRDAQLALRPYAHPDAARWAGPGADPATMEAAVLAAALVGHAHGRRYGAEHPFQDVDASLTSESAWLARVARQYVHAEAVARVRRRALAEISAEITGR